MLKGEKNLVNPEFYTQHKYCLNEREIKTLSGKQKLREFVCQHTYTTRNIKANSSSRRNMTADRNLDLKKEMKSVGNGKVK